MSKAQDTGTRVGEIDALRGIAAVAVMLFHYTTRIAELYPVGPATVDVRHGHFGVNLFFIISGYVIFMTLHRTRKPMDFVVSRFSRLFPAYWAAVLITFGAVFALGLPGKEVSLGQALANLAMIHGFFGVPHVDGVYWTLEVELLFYAGMFLLYRSGRLGQVHTAMWLLLGLRLAYYLSANLAGIDLPWRISRFLILGQIPWFAMGIAVYLLVQPRVANDKPKSLALLAGALALLALDARPEVAALSLGMAALVYAAATRRLPWLAHPVMVWLGAISYTLYLLHENIGWGVQLRLQGLGVPRDLGVLCAMALSLALATALTRWVEQPAMAWIRRSYRARHPK
jgi:peptidoglycan/LPS O-acetylase OafA/YrhL